MKLFIGGLAWATNEASLRAAFAKFGVVSDAVVILDRDTGRSRGFGFVTFAEAEDGKRALAEMNGFSLDGRAIRCSEATERPGRGRPDSRGPRPGGGGRPPGGGGGRPYEGGGRAEGPRGGGYRPERGGPPGGGGSPRGPAPSRSRFDNQPPPPDSDDRSKRSREKKRRVRAPVAHEDDRGGSRSRMPRRTRGGGGGGRPEIFKNLEDYDDDVG